MRKKATRRRSGYDGWALRLPEWRVPLSWTVSTTREEVRLLRLERPDLFGRGGGSAGNGQAKDGKWRQLIF